MRRNDQFRCRHWLMGIAILLSSAPLVRAQILVPFDSEPVQQSGSRSNAPTSASPLPQVREVRLRPISPEEADRILRARPVNPDLTPDKTTAPLELHLRTQPSDKKD
jgi:hypothetical protein